MAMIERDVVLVGKDASGNTTVDMPITRLGNLEDTAEIKTAPVSGDALAIVDSEASGEVKKISWADVMNAVKDAVGGDDGAALEALKQALTEHEADGTAHATASEKAVWNAKAEGEHNHDGRYYTESEVNTLLAGKESAGAAAGVQTKLDSHASDSVAHVTSEERAKWNSAGGVQIACGSYVGTGTWPSILLPFSPERLCIYSSHSGVMVYWQKSMRFALVVGTYGGYQYIGGLAVTLTQSGNNTQVSLTNPAALKLLQGTDPINGGDVYAAIGATGRTYEYEAWGEVTE